MMSQLNLPQKDNPWVNHEYFWYEVTEAEYGDNPTQVESIIVLQHNNDTGLTLELRFYRNVLIDRIKMGDRFMSHGLRLGFVLVNTDIYVRTDRNPLPADGF